MFRRSAKLARWTQRNSGNVSINSSDMFYGTIKPRDAVEPKSKRETGNRTNSPTKQQILEDARTLALLTQIMAATRPCNATQRRRQQLEEQPTNRILLTEPAPTFDVTAQSRASTRNRRTVSRIIAGR